MKIVRNYSDAELLTAIRDKLEMNNAIWFIYQSHFDSISSLITYNSGNQQDAEDIFQEVVVTFIDIVKKDKFRGESSIKTFLVSMARNLWLNELKKRGRSQLRDVVFEKGRDEPEADISQHIADREIKKQLMELLEQLGEGCKKILVMFYYEDLSIKEMLEHLPYENEQVVRNKKYKCLQQLTELIKDNPSIIKNFNFKRKDS
jgi:RNA polymerase sigma factor (sigma-70 family)